MTDLRGTGGIATARFDDEKIKLRWFVRIVFPSGPGEIRYTNIVGGLTVEIDPLVGVEAWTEHDVRIGPLQQGQDTALDVSWIDFADADGNNTWVGYLKTPGVRDVPCTVWRAHFNVATGAIYGAYPAYDGEMDEGRDSGTRVRIVLKPAGDQTRIPGRAFLPHMDEFLLMPRPGDQITIGTSSVPLIDAPRPVQPIIRYIPYSPTEFFF